MVEPKPALILWMNHPCEEQRSANSLSTAAPIWSELLNPRAAMAVIPVDLAISGQLTRF